MCILNWSLFSLCIRVTKLSPSFIVGSGCLPVGLGKSCSLMNFPLSGVLSFKKGHFLCKCLHYLKLMLKGSFQFLPDDDEAASMFTVVIDEECTQNEKKKKAASAGSHMSYSNLRVILNMTVYDKFNIYTVFILVILLNNLSGLL